MVNYKDVLGRPIYSIQEGRRCGRICDVVIDFQAHRILGVIAEGSWDNPSKVIALESISTFGKDSVMIQSDTQVEAPSENNTLAQAISNRINWNNLRVIKDSGEQMGSLTNLMFDDKSGEISNYEISGGIFKKLMGGTASLPKDGVIAVGVDCMVVNHQAEIEIKETEGTRKIVVGTIDELKVDLEKASTAAVEKIKGVKDKLWASRRHKDKPPEVLEPPKSSETQDE